MLLLGASDVFLVIIFLSLPSSSPVTKPSILALTPLPNLETLVTSKLQKLITLSATHPHSSLATSFIIFLNIAPLIQPQPLHYSPPHRPLSQHFLLRCANSLTFVKFHLFTTLPHQILLWPPCRSFNPSRFYAFASMMSFFPLPTGAPPQQRANFMVTSKFVYMSYPQLTFQYTSPFKHTYHANTSIFQIRPYFIHSYHPHY